MSKLEVTDWDDTQAIAELSSSLWEQTEPGFQIEGVTSPEQLMFVLDCLKSYVPEQVAGKVDFDSAYPWHGFGQFMPEPQGPHMDSDFKGVAAHFNISTSVPVRLGIPIGNQFHTELNSDTATEIREGETDPGKITVFSEGWPGITKKTLHHFDRKTLAPMFWSRYTQSAGTVPPQNNIPKIATESFELMKRYTSVL